MERKKRTTRTRLATCAVALAVAVAGCGTDSEDDEAARGGDAQEGRSLAACLEPVASANPESYFENDRASEVVDVVGEDGGGVQLYVYANGADASRGVNAILDETRVGPSSANDAWNIGRAGDKIVYAFRLEAPGPVTKETVNTCLSEAEHEPLGPASEALPVVEKMTRCVNEQALPDAEEATYYLPADTNDPPMGWLLGAIGPEGAIQLPFDPNGNLPGDDSLVELYLTPNESSASDLVAEVRSDAEEPDLSMDAGDLASRVSAIGPVAVLQDGADLSDRQLAFVEDCYEEASAEPAFP